MLSCLSTCPLCYSTKLEYSNVMSTISPDIQVIMKLGNSQENAKTECRAVRNILEMHHFILKRKENSMRRNNTIRILMTIFFFFYQNEQNIFQFVESLSLNNIS